MKHIKIGQLVTTAGIYNDIQKDRKFAEEVKKAFSRHASGDYGICSEDGKRLNDSGKDRIISVYKTINGNIWIITEADRSATTILYPSEY